VGREQQAVRFTDREQGIARFERFVRENIEPRSGEPSGAEGRCVDVQYVTRNDALMMYSPFLAENAQPGKRPADNQRPGYE